MNQGPFNSGYIPGPNVLNPPNPIAQLNPYGQSLPNLNYGIPGGNLVGSTNPLLFGSNQNINPVNPIQNSGNVNPFDPNQNFLRQQTYANPMMNPNNNFQSIPNMANNIAINDPDLQINKIMAERMIEREKVKEQTKEIYKRLSDKYDDEQDLEEMKKKQEELEEEEDKTKKKNSREERNKRRELLFGKGGLYNIPVDIYIPRSEYFYKRDRAFLEELILAPIKTMGATGRKLVTDFNKESLFDDKEAFQEQDILQLNDEDEYFERAIKDGIYLDYVKQQLFSFNINKTEQRSFREEKKNWFRPNGDIRMDNDIFSDVVTKPMDISLSSNDQFSTFVSNSIFSGRGNGKMRLFKLRIIIGKIIFRSHPMFSDEDMAASQVINLHKDFYSTLNMLNIPYLKKKRKNIQMKLDSYNNIHQLNDAQEIEIKNMKIFLDETSKLLNKEKKIINQKANLLYNKWLDLKKIRREQGFIGNPLKLNVIRFNDNENDPNIYDYAFILTNDKEVDPLPREEINRRAKISKNMVFLKVYINDTFAFETKPAPITYPHYEVEINAQFVMNLYTRPTKFEIELYINNKLEKQFEAEPPGMFSKTVTSSAILYEEIDFGKKDDEKLKKNEKSKKNKKYDDDETNKLLDEKNNIENDEDELIEKPKEKELVDNQLIEGTILLKTEWEGRAPDLPPTKIEDKLELVNKQLEFKEYIKKEFDIEYPFDVNDPRNVASVQEMKKEKLELMLKVYYKEYLLTYYDIYSKRHELLLKRLSKRSMDKKKFPILESQIEKSKELMEILEEFKKEEKTYILEEETQWAKRVKNSLEELKKKHKGRILTDEEYLNYQKDKIAAMKKDQILRGAAGYFQIVSQAEIIDNPVMLLKEFFMRVFTRSRKLAPIRVKPTPVKIEKADKIKVNIHIVKGYNIPIRINSPVQASIDEQKLYAVTHNSMYRNIFNQDDRRQEVFRNTYQMQNNIMNNSGPFSNNPHSNNESFSIGMNNSRGFGPMGMMGANPNFNNQMINPNNSNLSMYRNMGGERQDILNQIQNISSIEQNRINSFIEARVTYYDQEAVFRTDSIESIHPDYNHQFEFYIKPKDGKKTFTREELSKCPGVFYFTLYDEIKKEYSVSDKTNNIYIQKNERKYLGSFNIPFATVFQNASILDTICKVDIPKAVFGYYSDTISIFNLDTGEEEDTNITEKLEEDDDNHRYEGIQGLGNLHHFAQRRKQKVYEIKQIINPFVNSYVSLYITLDPIPSFSINDETDYISGFEDNGFLINATKWLNNLKGNAKFQNRVIRFFAENFDGCSVFMPRYLKRDGQMPYPQLFNENDDNAIEKASRYVSLIPFIEENQTWDYAEEMPDCWCTDNQFLDLGFGDYEEHAVLLCNYFNYIDQKQKTGCVSYLCLGDAHPEGSTVYVIRLTPDFKQVEFWNAKTGDCFYFEKTLISTKFLCIPMSTQYKNSKSNSNKICPLKSVGAIVTFDNILINNQDETDPSLIDFDLNNPSLWLPFLTEEARNRYFPEGIKTVQRPIEYTPPSEKDALNLKEAIRDYLKRVIREERAKIKGPGDKPLRTEGLNRVNQNIERILEKYEMHNFNETKSGINYNRLKRINSDKDEIKNKRHFLQELEKFQNEIKDELRDKNNIYGFPINLPFTTMKEIWQQIKLTNVHLIGGENTELNLSIYVDPLPSGVNSVWIFLAILQNN
jgi:coiled-coil and C2 domain-containing protein 2A